MNGEPKNEPMHNREPSGTAGTDAGLLERIAQLDAAGIERRLGEIDLERKTATEAGLDALEAEVEALQTRRAALDALEQRRAAMGAVIAGGGNVLSGGAGRRNLPEVLRSGAYENAYAAFVKTGDDRECRALLTDLAEGGTVPVPAYIADRVETAWRDLTLIRRLRRTAVKGTLEYPFEYSASPAVVHTEGSAPPAEETLVLGNVPIAPGMLKKWITVSHEVMSLKGRAFLDYVYGELEQRILELAEAQFLSVVRAAPAAASQTSPGVPQITVAAIGPGTLFAAMAALSSSALRRCAAVMHPQTYFNQIMSLTDDNHRPVWTSVSGGNGPSYYVSGVEVILNEAMPAGTGSAGTGAEILVGDLDGGLVNLPDGVEVQFVTDPYSLAEDNKIKIVGRMFAGFGVVRDRSFARIIVSE